MCRCLKMEKEEYGCSLFAAQILGLAHIATRAVAHGAIVLHLAHVAARTIAN